MNKRASPLRKFYTQKHAQHYNRTWRSFSKKTLAATLSLLDVTQLQQEAETRAQPLRILDAACGTGLLLNKIGHLLPNAELYGVDASAAMLNQATNLLKDRPQIHLAQASLNDGATAGLPYAPAFFDLITCTNTLHYFPNPVETLQGLRRLLIPTGHLIIEDYTLRGFPFPWKAFEWAIKLYDPQHIRLYDFPDALALCQQAGLQLLRGDSFPIDLFCQGWTLLLQHRICG